MKGKEGSLNETPVSERVHIALFGRTNAGKSSLLNAITGQNAAVVSGIKGTTTDPVQKAMELQPAGPVVIIDTPGLDDDSTLGGERVERAGAVLRKTDIAVIVIDSETGVSERDNKIAGEIAKRKIPFIIVFNKCDKGKCKSEKAKGETVKAIDKAEGVKGEIIKSVPQDGGAGFDTDNILFVSAKTGEGIEKLKNTLASLAIRLKSENDRPLVKDLVKKGGYALLVAPIDSAAPKGRLILPQQQVIRELIDNGSVPIIVNAVQLQSVIDDFGSKISLIVTDSQAVAAVYAAAPDEIPLTTFSILFSRYKGELQTQLEGLERIKSLSQGDTVLISEGCTHHRQCGDIGTVKIPLALKKITGKNIKIETTSGGEFPKNLAKYKAVIHCGGCMLNEKEMKYRIDLCRENGVAITNYGMVLSLAAGTLHRCIRALGAEI